jgi:imidazoleglycerol phosphate synthase glutamine amidotransferase subunit HisH
VGLNQVEIPGKGRYAMQFSSIKQRQSKKAIRTIAYECDLGKMNITNIEVDMQLFAQQEEDARMADQLQASDTEMKGRSPLQEQKRKKKWQSSGSHS